jgi:hypothetical protein
MRRLEQGVIPDLIRDLHRLRIGLTLLAHGSGFFAGNAERLLGLSGKA